ncbi:hypothetical protein [uncultured Corynebacterium sp.]|uniref:hypothetical protein n=1 Tax=uncultured Corynebacterium sp. TaxID=159447 RepID=UPI0025CD4B82|nr:hypothetical protein [uncultured Corynebacterium sp.]
MKSRRFIAATLAAAAITTGVTAPADARPLYPEPLNQVMNEMRKVGGPQAPNLLLVPAATSSVNWILNILAWTGVLTLAGIGQSSK